MTVDETMNYETARAELVTVVERLEAGGTTLEETLELWERGEKLADLCQAKLDGAKKRLEKAQESPSDGPSSAAAV